MCWTYDVVQHLLQKEKETRLVHSINRSSFYPQINKTAPTPFRLRADLSSVIDTRMRELVESRAGEVNHVVSVSSFQSRLPLITKHC